MKHVSTTERSQAWIGTGAVLVRRVDISIRRDSLRTLVWTRALTLVQHADALANQISAWQGMERMTTAGTQSMRLCFRADTCPQNQHPMAMRVRTHHVRTHHPSVLSRPGGGQTVDTCNKL